MKHYDLLSDAIIDGAKLRKQGRLFLVNNRGETCALGAALHAILGYVSDHYNVLLQRFGSLLNFRVACPVADCCFHDARRLFQMAVTHLNDDHKWTREDIAGWVATIEAKLGMVELVSDESATVNTGITEGVHAAGNEPVAIARN